MVITVDIVGPLNLQSNLFMNKDLGLLFGAALGIISTNPLHLARAATKETASGIFALLESDTTTDRITNLPARECWTNPNIAGVVLRTNWATVERSKGEFNWSFLDTGIALAQSHRKKIIISVDAGTSSPSWIYSLGAAQFTLTTYGVMAAPWDPIFKRHWSRFWVHFGNRYDSSPHLVCVTMTGPGRTVEYVFAQTTADVQELNASVGVQGWITAANQNTDAFVSALRTTPVFCATGTPVVPDSAVAMTAVVNYGFNTYAGHFGVQSNALTAVWPSSVFAHTTLPTSGLSPLGFQMLQPVASGQLKGTLQQAIDHGISLGAHFIEVYDVDCEDPTQQSVLASANQILTTNYP
jgi:hypothetical protein